MKIKILLIIGVILAIVLALNSCTLDQTTNGGTTEKPDKTIIQPTDQNKEGLVNVPDLPYTTIPKVLTVKEVVEHRSALHGQQVTAKGYIVELLLGEDACPTGKGENIMEPKPKPLPAGCGRPYIRVADTMDKNRDLKYDLFVYVAETETGYKVGERVEIEGVVSASKVAVIMDTIVY